jgi:hypothetical protein
MSHLDDDHLLNLLSGLVAGDAADEMLAHVESCGYCESRFRGLSAERERIRSGAAEALARLPEPAPAAPAGASGGVLPGHLARFRWGALRWGVVAAAAVTIVWVVVTARGPGSLRGDMVPWLPTLPNTGPLMVTRHPGTGDPDTLLTQGLAAYARGDMGAAARLLGAAHASGPMDELGQVYCGSALARNGEWREASKRLSGVAIDALPQPWRDDARWTLQAAWRASGDTARADSLLDVLTADGRGELTSRAKAERARLRRAQRQGG